MDNERAEAHLREGARRLGWVLPDAAASLLIRFGAELLRWNARVNLTAITDPDEVVEKHLLDSLAPLAEVDALRPNSCLDIGTGAGLPGVPLRITRPDLTLTLVDSVGKKIGFVKHAIATLGLAPGARALHLTAAGQPEKEGLVRADLVVSRAFAEPRKWLELARSYVAPAGHVLAMLGQKSAEDELRAAGEATGFDLVSCRVYRLPFSGADRAIAAFRPRS